MACQPRRRRIDSHLSLLNQLRLTIAIPLGTASIIAGGAINTYVSTDHESPLAIARTTGEPMSIGCPRQAVAVGCSSACGSELLAARHARM